LSDIGRDPIEDAYQRGRASGSMDERENAARAGVFRDGRYLTPDQLTRGAVSRIDAALKIIEAERASDGNLQMGRAKASQVIELLRAAGGQ
jgi:hypothetical protein